MKQHKMKHIKGTLKPGHSHIVTRATSGRINNAANLNGLRHLIKNHKRETGIIEINSVVIASQFPSNDVLDLVGSLYDFLQEDGIAGLGMHGELMMTLETDQIQPIMIKVTIEDSTISHQEVVMEWTNKKTYNL